VIAVGVDQPAHPHEQAGAFSSIVAAWSERQARKCRKCKSTLPSVAGDGIPVYADEPISMRIRR
jgi:hypothetical protein